MKDSYIHQDGSTNDSPGDSNLRYLPGDDSRSDGVTQSCREGVIDIAVARSRRYDSG
jgi:hypothetical protein